MMDHWASERVEDCVVDECWTTGLVNGWRTVRVDE